jgi:hypothetical protein
MTKNIKISYTHSIQFGSGHPERRTSASDRRKNEDRRSLEERRFDSRLAMVKQRRTIKVWLRSMTHSRLGVDRRKKEDRRMESDRRYRSIKSILTKEEITDLLSP